MIIGVYHNKNTPLPKSVKYGNAKTVYKSLGHKISLSREELINKKYWRDVIISNSVERVEIRNLLNRAYVDGRERILKEKAYGLGIQRPDEVVEKYIGGEVGIF